MTKPRKQPAKLTPEKAQELIEGLFLGSNLAELCKQPGMPTDRAVRLARSRDPELADEFMRAFIACAEVYLEEAEAMLDKARTRDEILKAKTKINHAEWKAEKLLPAYQAVQKMEVAHTGPMVFGWDDGPESCPKCGYNMKDVSPVMS